VILVCEWGLKIELAMFANGWKQKLIVDVVLRAQW
jgi:hypothetical protein